jgi:hypothetical protein
MSLGYTIEMIIPIPQNYDETELSEKGKFAILELIYFPLENELHLDNFFVYSQLYFKDARSYEKKAFKGIGKLMLNYAINLLLDEHLKKKSSILDMNITLKAEGGSISKNYPLEYIIPYSKKYINTYIRDKYSNNVNVLDMLNTLPIKDLRYKMCEFEENKKLVNYYNYLGFDKIEDVNGISILMKAKLLKVLHKCNNSKIIDIYI